MPTAEEEDVVDVEDLKNDDPDTLRIMISTDNHLGYAERDNVRGMDSFAAFEEVLYLSKRFNCDMVLLAGDLFHDNRPTRRTLHKTMEILRRYCMGPDPVQVQILSSTCPVNYQDANYAVQLPIFSIHGNHDDPSRDPGSRDLLAALDLLSVSNLINYFGRQEEVDKVEIAPVLLQKGATKVALYGLGSVRDERLNRMWTKDKVRFLRPPSDAAAAADEDDDDEQQSGGFFNMFALHQNRDLGRGNKNCVQETMIPPWMDVVIWGHEHECLIDWVESVVGTFRISQPGSSVATSLVSGEAARKQVGILDIRGQNFRMKAVPLTQVRSFVTTEISLREHRANLDPEDPNIDKKVTAVLDEEVQLLMLNARESREELLRDARAKGSDAGEESSPLKYKLEKPDEVLVRIRVAHNGFTALSNQRFGAKFVGSVANPSEILLFHRRKDAKSASTIKKKNIEPIAPEELERTNMEDLVREVLADDKKLEVLAEQHLSSALEDFVEKSRSAAISEIAAEILDQKQQVLIKRSTGDADKLDSENDDDDEQNILDKSAEKPTKTKKKSKTRQVEDSMDEETENAAPASRKRKATSKKKTAPVDDSSSDNDDVVETPQPATSRKTQRPSRSTTATKNKKRSIAEDWSDDEIEEDDESEVEEQRTKRKQPSKKAQAARKPRRKFDDSDSDDLSPDWGTANTKSQY